MDDLLRTITAEQPYPVFLMTLSGAHLYGFPSPDSDYDLRGVHVLSPRDAMGLFQPRDTLDKMYMRDGFEIDIVTHDLKKFFELMLKKNGLVLEQIYSPLVIEARPEVEELKAIARRCVTRYHKYHYYGFAESQWKLFLRDSPHRVKPLLYIFRVLLTGIHLLRTGEVESNLVHLNEIYHLPYIPELIARKVEGPEKATLDEGDVTFYQQEFERLLEEMEQSFHKSSLPEKPDIDTKQALNDLLLRLRLQYI